MTLSFTALGQVLTASLLLQNVFATRMSSLRPQAGTHRGNAVKPKVFLIDMVSKLTLKPCEC